LFRHQPETVGKTDEEVITQALDDSMASNNVTQTTTVLKPQSSRLLKRLVTSVCEFVYDYVYDFQPVVVIEDIEPDIMRQFQVDSAAETVSTFIEENYAKMILGLVVAVALSCGIGFGANHLLKDEVVLETSAQGKKSRGLRVKRRRQAAKDKKKFMKSSGQEKSPEEEGDLDEHWAEDMFDAADEYQQRWDEHESSRWKAWNKEVDDEYNGSYRKGGHMDDYESRDAYNMYRQAVQEAAKRKQMASVDPVKQRAIQKAKTRKVVVKQSDVKNFLNQANLAMARGVANLKPQAFNPSKLATGIYKFFVNGQYRCTATHVGNRLYTVLHALSEDATASYTAANHVRNLTLDWKTMTIVNKEICYFEVNGIPSPFKTKNFKKMGDAAIVTVYGFGGGNSTEPEAVVGFASPLGWCNARTRDGDCTSPVLNQDGNIVGFWTHGNGKDFGRFEVVDEAFLDQARTDTDTVLHTGLAFQSALPCPAN